MVLGLEAEVAFDEDVDVGGGVARRAAQGGDVLYDEVELALRVCVVFFLWSCVCV